MNVCAKDGWYLLPLRTNITLLVPLERYVVRWGHAEAIITSFKPNQEIESRRRPLNMCRLDVRFSSLQSFSLENTFSTLGRKHGLLRSVQLRLMDGQTIRLEQTMRLKQTIRLDFIGCSMFLILRPRSQAGVDC